MSSWSAACQLQSESGQASEADWGIGSELQLSPIGLLNTSQSLIVLPCETSQPVLESNYMLTLEPRAGPFWERLGRS
jgi:hypothetical protein